jgi:23S rRNA pseudouridine1911/1915/1917 synthase
MAAPKKDWSQVPVAPIISTNVENLQVLFEDNHVIVVNKRSSDIVQADRTGDVVLSDIVKEYIKKKYNKPGEVFLGTVHRIDRPVSGAVVYAKTSKALSRLTVAFKDREVKKTYWAVVKGQFDQPKGTVVNYLWKDERQNKTFAFKDNGKDRKESELSYQVMGESEYYTFVEVYPKTGRHHQIRATMAFLGCPIKGDVKYGSKRTNENASIHLHARKIGFNHPTQKHWMEIIAPLPEDVLWNAFLQKQYGVVSNE